MPEIVQPSKDLIERLPRTFRPALNDQFRNWELLFPAEQRTLRAQLDWLSRLPADEFQRLFAPVVEIEGRMDLPRRDPAGLTVRQAGILARSPYYTEWRAEVGKIFGRIEDGVERSGRITRTPRLLISILPPGLPNGTFWPELSKRGTWVPLNGTFDRFVTPLVSSLVGRKLPAGVEDIEGEWILECDSRLSRLAGNTRATVLSWTALEAARREFLARLNTIPRDLAAVDRTNEELRRLDLGRLTDRRMTPRVREFVRSVFLSGNGSLVFNNSFVQWSASEALRRVQPQVTVAYFGIRQKLKPFSSTVLFEDQSRSNPVADENDPAGSLVDGMLLSEYVHLSAERVANPRDRRLTFMAACDLNRILVLGPNVPQPATGELTPEELSGFALRWLAFSATTG